MTNYETRIHGFFLAVAFAGFALLGYAISATTDARVVCYEAAKVNPQVTCECK